MEAVGEAPGPSSGGGGMASRRAWRRRGHAVRSRPVGDGEATGVGCADVKAASRGAGGATSHGGASRLRQPDAEEEPRPRMGPSGGGGAGSASPGCGRGVWAPDRPVLAQRRQRFRSKKRCGKISQPASV
jgi:hypothetical protein